MGGAWSGSRPRPAMGGATLDARLLLVEDDPSIRASTDLGLSRAGFRVTSVADGHTALAQLEQRPCDLVLLDLMLPGLDGLEVCRRIRRTRELPIVMLTARSDLTDVVVGLELGADDYVTKPFRMPELVARVRAVLRRANATPTSADVIAIDGLVIDPPAFSVTLRGRPVELTATEFRLLHELARHPGQVLTRQVLLERVWDHDYLGDSRLVDVAIGRLRSKIEDDPAEPRFVLTVRGVGYRLERGAGRDT